MQESTNQAGLQGMQQMSGASSRNPAHLDKCDSMFHQPPAYPAQVCWPHQCMHTLLWCLCCLRL